MAAPASIDPAAGASAAIGVGSGERGSGELFESVVVHANDVVLVTEAEPLDLASGGPRVLYVNPAFTRMTGYQPHEIIGRTPRMLQSPKTDRAELDRLRAALRRWEPVEVELLNVGKNGVEFWVQINITPVRDARGWYTHWIAIQRDITVRKHREIAVLTMLNSTSDLMVILDAERRVRMTSPTSVRILSLDPACLTGQFFLDLVHPHDRSQAEGLLAPGPGPRVGRSAHTEVRLRHQDRSWRWMEVSAANLDVDPGGSLVLACTDVTAHKQTAAALEEVDRRFRSAFDDAPIGMALTSPTGRFVQVNEALTQLLGRDRDTLLGMATQDVTLEADRDLAERQRRSLLRGTSRRHRHETRFVHADGGVVEVLHSSSVVPGRAGAPQYVIDHIEDITERKAFEAELNHQVLHDTLTGLPNRALLTDRLDQALRVAADAGSEVAVLFLDVDRFKTVNDTYGHQVGDAVLTELARRLEGAVRAGDTVARFAGDEFVVLCHDDSPGGAAATAARLAAVLTAPVVVAEVSVLVSASIGIALSQPDKATAETLLRNGDAAMYAAKDAGRDRVAMFDEALGARVRSRVQMESELHTALAKDEMRLHYQPQLRLSDGAVTGLEALLRWNHPRRGLLAPAGFLDIAEECGLMVELGRWVLTAAAQEAARRRADTGTAPVMWVNVSAAELLDPGFSAEVLRTLEEHRLPGEAFGIEITETVLVQDVARARTTLRGLQARGVHLAVDDFGTGYSSLSYLAEFPLDTVKIDRSFVTGLDDNARRRECFAIVNAVVGLAHALKLQVIAEGVETTSQAQILHGLGCEHAQGYLLGRPTTHGAPATATPLPGGR